MASSEFDIIERFFTWPSTRSEAIVLGVGDDAAEIALGGQHRLLVDLAQIREGRDFQADDDPAVVGYRLLADASTRLFARAAEPLAFTLALSLPEADENWLQRFSQGLAQCARRYDIALIGGDTTRGPRAAVLHLHGTIGAEGPVPERGARAGDLVYVCGACGDAALALLHLAGELQLPLPERERALRALQYPQPELAWARAIAGLASSATEMIDGPARSLDALLARSGCGASIQAQRLPLGEAAQSQLQRAGGWTLAWQGPTPGGLCFTLPADAQQAFEHRNAGLARPCSWIGLVERAPGLRCHTDDGTEL